MDLNDLDISPLMLDVLERLNTRLYLRSIDGEFTTEEYQAVVERFRLWSSEALALLREAGEAA